MYFRAMLIPNNEIIQTKTGAQMSNRDNCTPFFDHLFKLYLPQLADIVASSLISSLLSVKRMAFTFSCA